MLLGKTYGGLMVDVRPTNAKLWARAIRIVRALTGLDEAAARKLIEKAGGRAKVALVMHHAGVTRRARARAAGRAQGLAARDHRRRGDPRGGAPATAASGPRPPTREATTTRR